MQFKLVALLTLVAASVNGAVLNKRSDPCVCGTTRHYSGVDTQAAINQGRTGQRFTFGRQEYAHPFHALDPTLHFTKCTAPFLVEFPLVAGGVYAGGHPGLDRVVYDLSGTFCGCITHTGAVGNGFQHCA
ncbi:Ribonuclease/ribotoxin [Thelephora ganbajun]|uniref:Ribonuclease/ribotoxin n=1 Tax=Thelephora ganbajun TaxID=370292 RepID=A0ACB6Z7H4_THEGA|nr:Ribonuclease/ribotoxin [Thelephora ganbajun]